MAAVALDVSDQELKRLRDAAGCGARFALGHHGAASFIASFIEIARFAERLVPLGWHIELHFRRDSGASVLAEPRSKLTKLPVNLVIAHVANIPGKGGIDQPDFLAMRDLRRAGRCWVKLSAGYRISAEPPYRDMIPFAQKFVAARPSRIGRKA